MSAPAQTRGMVSVPGPVFLELLWVTVRLGECHAVLADVVALAGEAPELSDEHLRVALVTLREHASRLLEGEIR